MLILQGTGQLPQLNQGSPMSPIQEFQSQGQLPPLHHIHHMQSFAGQRNISSPYPTAQHGSHDRQMPQQEHQMLYRNLYYPQHGWGGHSQYDQQLPPTSTSQSRQSTGASLETGPPVRPKKLKPQDSDYINIDQHHHGGPQPSGYTPSPSQGYASDGSGHNQGQHYQQQPQQYQQGSKYAQGNYPQHQGSAPDQRQMQIDQQGDFHQQANAPQASAFGTQLPPPSPQPSQPARRDQSQGGPAAELVTKKGEVMESMAPEAPFDPNLICPLCMRNFRKGEIKKYKKHVNTCQGQL